MEKVNLEKVNQAALTISPNTTHSFNTTRTYTIGGGSGTGAVSDSLVSGSATRTAERTYRANAGSGTYTIRVTKAGDSTYNPITQDFTFTMVKANQAALTISPSSTHTFNTTRTYTIGGGSGTGAVTDSLVSGSATRTAARTYRANAGSGTYTIRVTKAGDSNYNPITQDFTFTMVKANQAALTISPSSTHTFNTTRTYTIGGGSGTGAVSDSLVSGSATRTAARTYRANAGSGTYTIRVTKAGDSNYNPRTQDFTFTMVKANQAALTISPSSTHTFNTTRTYTIGGGSGTGAVSDSLASGSATRTAARTYKADAGNGTYTIRVTKAGDSTYNPITQDFTFTMEKVNLEKVNQAALTISPNTTHSFNTTRTYTIGGGSGTGAVSDSLVSGSATRTAERTYRANAGSGTYTIRVTKAGDSTYNPITQDFTFTMAPDILTVSPSSSSFKMIILNNNEEKTDTITLAFDGDNLVPNFIQQVEVGKIEISNLKGSISKVTGTADYIVTLPDKVTGSATIPIKLKLEQQPGSLYGSAEFTLVLSDFKYGNGEYIINPGQLEVTYMLLGGVDVN
jgi:trimeric autotransporter adhesin